MKSKSILNYILIASMFFLSCEKDKNYSGGTSNSNSNNNNSQTGTFSGVFGEKTISTNDVKVVDHGTFMVIHAYSGNDTIQLAIFSDIQEGVYTAPSEADIWYSTSNKDYLASYTSQPNALISINEYNDSAQTISGTYSGTLTDYANSNSSILVKNGVFENIKLNNNNDSTGGNNQGQLSYLLDGTLKSYDNCTYRSENGDVIMYSYESGIGLDFVIKGGIRENTTYPLSKQANSTTAWYHMGEWQSINGAITISTIDQNNVVKGTFYFDAESTFNTGGGTSTFSQGVFTAVPE